MSRSREHSGPMLMRRGWWESQPELRPEQTLLTGITREPSHKEWALTTNHVTPQDLCWYSRTQTGPPEMVYDLIMTSHVTAVGNIRQGPWQETEWTPEIDPNWSQNQLGRDQRSSIRSQWTVDIPIQCQRPSLNGNEVRTRMSFNTWNLYITKSLDCKGQTHNETYNYKNVSLWCVSCKFEMLNWK